MDVSFFALQLDEDIKTILQRYEGMVEEDSEQTSNEATLSYLDFLANLDSEEVRQEVAKRSAATKEHTRKLLHYVEISGPYSSTVSKEKPSGEIQVEEKAHKGTYVQWDERVNISPTLLFLFSMFSLKNLLVFTFK